MALEGKTLALAVGATGVAAIGLGTALLYMGQPGPTPERPKPPPAIESMMNNSLKYSQPVWRALVESDAKRFKLPVPTLQELGQPNPYFEELSARRKLKVKGSIETAHLRLSLDVARRKATLEGQSYAVDHLVLRIENRVPKFLAYRVETWLPDRTKCERKGDIAHNALVLEPNQAVERTECLYRKEENIDVMRVEVMEVLPIGAFYISRVPPNHTLHEPRTSAGHVSLAGDVCPQTFSWRDIQDGIDRKQIGWRDVMDFYTRHNCDEYSFFVGYRYRTQSNAPLPARPLD